MAFKMKGPGLPGFRKQVGRGFYKSTPSMPMGANRSPILQGDGKKDYEEGKKGVINEARIKYSELTEEEQANVQWDDFVNTEIRKFDDENQKITQTKITKTGVIPGKEDDYEGPLASDKEWNEFLKTEKGKQYLEEHSDKQVILEEINTKATSIDPEVEWSNMQLGYFRQGIATHTVTKDKEDGSFRYVIEDDNQGGIRFGNLSANDIQGLVKQGKLKHHKGKLLMSKDYVENVYQPMIDMQREGNKNRKEWEESAYQTRLKRYKEIKQQIEDEGIKENNIFGKRRKEYTDRLIELKRALHEENPKIWNRNGYAQTDMGWMDGDPNYGGIEIGIHADDEVVHGSGKVDLFDTGKNRTIKGVGDINLQGSRPGDWIKDEATGKYVLKDDAITVPLDEWNEMTEEEQKLHMRDLDASNRNYKKDVKMDDSSGTFLRHVKQQNPGPEGNEEDFQINQDEIAKEKQRAGIGYTTTVERDEKTGKVTSTGRTFDDGDYVPD
jgi:hypothetical protein